MSKILRPILHCILRISNAIILETLVTLRVLKNSHK